MTAAKNPRILIISCRYFGDAFIATSLVARLRHKWPHCHIAFLTFEHIQSVLEGIPGIDEVIAVPPRPSRWTQFRWLLTRWHQYDYALLTQSSSRAFWYAFAMGKTSVLPPTIRNKDSWWKIFLASRHAKGNALGPEILRMQATASAIGVENSPIVLNTATVALPPDIDQITQPSTPHKLQLVLHPITRQSYKDWSEEKWHQLIEALIARGANLFLTGSGHPEECKVLHRLSEINPDCITVLAGRLSFAQAATVITRMDAYIGGDTGTTHIAAATGVPTIALFGPTDPHLWGPWGKGQSTPWQKASELGIQKNQNVTILQMRPYGSRCPCQKKGCHDHALSQSDCLHALTVDQVLTALDAALRQNKNP